MQYNPYLMAELPKYLYFVGGSVIVDLAMGKIPRSTERIPIIIMYDLYSANFEDSSSNSSKNKEK